ncbi:VOC family protein [Devosia algicola]|uniref:VOC family protein n=1 Tax=Devosia algicola TaxID=3026418 RepID=A0ABY7YM29_9HYPH|nr:VOC family protein [Devosia algicola]WDR02140.1 VOC family protein [Devosia algicola]
MTQAIATVALIVADYDEAIAFYCEILGFTLRSDDDQGDGKRWVVVAPNGPGAQLLLARADNSAQKAAIGNQAGGRVAFFLETDDFAAEHACMCAKGVRFIEQPRNEPYGTVAVFEDLYANKWDLIEPKRQD